MTQPTPDLLAKWADRITALEAENAELRSDLEMHEGAAASLAECAAYWRRRASRAHATEVRP